MLQQTLERVRGLIGKCISPVSAPANRSLHGWTEAELAVLRPEQFVTKRPRMTVRPAVLPREPTRRPPPRAEQPDPYQRYLVDREEVAVDGSLAGPVFLPEPRGGHGLRPRLEVERIDAPPGRHIVYYFEFDTVYSFDSPNYWRSPQLLPHQAAVDPAGRGGGRYSLFRSGHHNPNDGPVVLFPFRVTAMRLPDDWQLLDKTEMERQAAALGFGLDRAEVVREIFNYVRQFVTWSKHTKVRSSLDVFCSGVSPCGQANALCSLLLEMNGVRTRGVSGFDPVVRVITDGKGGHSAAEFYDPDAQKWNYLDPYLDLCLPGVAAADFAEHPIGEFMLGNHRTLRPLKRQFMYRRYFDRLNRMAPVSMLQLNGDEASWGTQWPLVERPRFEPRELLPEEITVHARARYLITNGQRVQHRTEVPVDAGCDGIVASPWSHTSFVVHPRKLLGIG